MNSLCSGKRLDDIYAEIAELKDHADPWLARAAATMLAGSPGSARLAYALQGQAAALESRHPVRGQRRLGAQVL